MITLSHQMSIEGYLYIVFVVGADHCLIQRNQHCFMSLAKAPEGGTDICIYRKGRYIPQIHSATEYEELNDEWVDKAIIYTHNKAKDERD